MGRKFLKLLINGWRINLGSIFKLIPKFGENFNMDPVLSFIYNQEGEQKLILEHLHNLITSFPEVTYKIRYRIPFYYRKSWICYLNPVKNDGVELAFVRANELSNENGLLDFKDRKQVAGIIFHNIKEIREEAILEILEEAFLLDENVKYASKRKGN